MAVFLLEGVHNPLQLQKDANGKEEGYQAKTATSLRDPNGSMK